MASSMRGGSIIKCNAKFNASHRCQNLAVGQILGSLRYAGKGIFVFDEKIMKSVFSQLLPMISSMAKTLTREFMGGV